MSRGRKPARSRVPIDRGPDQPLERGERLIGLAVDPGGQRVVAVRAVAESKLDVYALRGAITGDQRDAGLRLRADWMLAGGQGRVTASYAGRTSRGPEELTDRRLDARRRWQAAIAAVGVELSDVTVSVCCQNDWAGSSRRISALRRALACLVGYYGGARVR